MAVTCVYCLQSNELRDEQILLRGENLYLCAPRGQLIEGYLAIVPYRCIGSFSLMPVSYFADLARIRQTVLKFYERAYGSAQATFYEQGRGGGGVLADYDDGFPFHAHLCCLPLAIDLHNLLAPDFVKKVVSGPQDLSVFAQNEPYVYVESMNEKAVYLAHSDEGRSELERKRLKPAIAALIGVPERGDWRAYPGDRELRELIKRWRFICQT